MDYASEIKDYMVIKRRHNACVHEAFFIMEEADLNKHTNISGTRKTQMLCCEYI